GLDTLKELRELYLDGNQLTEIAGLENCVELEHIDFRYNKISKISGLGTLDKLEWLYLSEQENNPLRVVLKELGKLSSVGYALEPQRFVLYSQQHD
ncbi:MAG TPA: leucine-rich repeat domain-containing protein, partial [bacterium]|nr:leucine-rich repeat domain-containing protein [bacterium]